MVFLKLVDTEYQVNHKTQPFCVKVVHVQSNLKELLNKEQIDFKELFTDHELFYTINLLLNKELLPI